MDGRFEDTTPVRLTLEIDRGALEALIDNPLVLHPDVPDAHFGNAVRRGVKALKQSWDLTGEEA
jgi:hypothetical protein